MLSWLVAIVVAVLPFGTRLFVASTISGFHEYEALFFYGTDIVILIFIWWVWRHHRAAVSSLFHRAGGPPLAAMLIAGLSAALGAPSLGLAIYGLLRLAMLMTFAYCLGVTLSTKKIFEVALVTLAVVAVAQACVGLAQFKQQGSVGFQKFGEPALISYTGAASTIQAEGGRVLRVYGTFPHPNVFAAFMVFGLLSLAYWYLWCEEQLSAALFTHPRQWWTLPRALKTLNVYLTHRYFYLRLLIAAATFLVTLGLVLSFSRSGWLASAIAMLFYALLTIYNRRAVGGALRLVLMVAACATAAILLFQPIVFPRASLTFTEPAVAERLSYNDLGGALALQNPGGVGPSNQVLYSVREHLYQDYGFTQVWKWEPIHNLYLLITVEFGWLGLLSFLVFLGMVTWQLARGLNSERALALALLCAMLVVGLFDHYLWDLQPGRLMLWFAVGLCLSQVNTSRNK